LPSIFRRVRTLQRWGVYASMEVAFCLTEAIKVVPQVT